jgi:hypothetical protein
LGGENEDEENCFSNRSRIRVCDRCGTIRASPHWLDLDAVHKHVIESLPEMEHARDANHYDMMGHGAKAEEHLRAAERELGLAIDAARASAH